MDITVILTILLIISFFLALRSMKDLKFSDEIGKVIRKSKIKGTIVFFKDKVRHY